MASPAVNRRDHSAAPVRPAMTCLARSPRRPALDARPAVAVLALAYLIAAAAQRRPRGRHLPQRPVRPGRLHAVGQRLVRRPPPARLLAARARARLAWLGVTRPAGGALDDRRRARCSGLIAGRFPPAGRARGRRLVRAGRRVALLSCRVPFDLGLAIGLAALLALLADRIGVALALAVLTPSPAPSPARSSRSRAWPRAGRRIGARRHAGLIRGRGRTRARAGARARRARPDRGARARVPRRRHAAVRGLGLLPGARRRAADRALLPQGSHRRARLVVRIGAVLYAVALTGAFVLPTPVGGNADRLGALSAGPLAALRAAGRLGARAGVRCCCWRSLAPRCSTGRRTHRSPTSRRPTRDPSRALLLLRPAARRAARARRRHRRVRRAIEVVPPTGSTLGGRWSRRRPAAAGSASSTLPQRPVLRGATLDARATAPGCWQRSPTSRSRRAARLLRRA